MLRNANNDMLRMVMRGFDAAIAVSVGMFSLWCLSSRIPYDPVEYHLLIIAGGLLLPAVGETFGLYTPWRGRSVFNMFGTYVASWLVAVLLISVFLVMTQSGYIYSRLWMGFSSVGVLVFGLFLRGTLYIYLRRLRASGYNLKSVLFIGRPENLEHIQQRLNGMPYVGYRIDRTILHDDEAEVMKAARQLASDSAFQRNFNEIWLSYPLSDGSVVNRLADALVSVPVELRYFPDLTDVRLLNHRMAQVADMFSIDLNYSPLNGPARFVKTLEDRLLGTLLFLVCLPVALVIGLCVWLTMGWPVLFKQYRHGLDGKRFKIYKFRSMKLHASKDSTCQARHGDLRITRLGSWLRQTSLDELPQFYNVLQGRMSLVGPRPHAMDHNAMYKDLIGSYMQRNRVKPGITGWAQVHGLRGITEDVGVMQKRIEYDLYYINNWSLGLDLKILLLTIKRGFINDKP